MREVPIVAVGCLGDLHEQQIAGLDDDALFQALNRVSPNLIAAGLKQAGNPLIIGTAGTDVEAAFGQGR